MTPKCWMRTIRQRRGAVVVLTLAMLLTLLVCAAFAIDVGYICSLTAEQQNTADAASLAGAGLLHEGQSDIAYDYVRDIIARNQKYQGYQSLEDQVIELGHWDSVTRTFTALDPADWATGAFAVRVRAYRNDTQLFFAPVIGHKTTDVSREAVAAGSRPCRGVWGLEGITAGSIYADSYDSGDGPYDPGNFRENGDLCSGQAITISGSIELHGDAMCGFGYPFTVAGTSGMMTGMTTASINEVPTVTLELGDAPYSNDNDLIGETDSGRSPWRGQWHLDISGGDILVIPSGSYYFDSVKLSGGGRLRIDGTATFYVAGSFDGGGGVIVNTSGRPNDLTIYSVGSSLKLGGGVTFFGSIIAPYADVVMAGSSGTLFGGIIGKTLAFKGGYVVHVDESLPMFDLLPAPPLPTLVR